MDDFIRKHASLFLSTFFMVVCVGAAGYFGLYVPATANRADLHKATAYFNKENSLLNKKKNFFLTADKETKKNATKTEQTGLRSIPAFLERINKLANDHKVIIRKLEPDAENKITFIIEMIADYFVFTEFSGSLEGLNVLVNDLEVRPYDDTKSPPVHVIKFSITPYNDAAPLSTNRIAGLAALTKQKNKRNPFQRFAARTGRSCVDQTWLHILSGIGIINNEKIATVDNFNYNVGDMVPTMGMKIVAIETTRVEFVKKASTGLECHILKFRKEKSNSEQRGLR
jgi:hypothetical protein